MNKRNSTAETSTAVPNPALLNPQPTTFIRMRTVMQITGLSRTTIYRLIAAGQFPKARRLGPRASAFVSAEIEKWGRDRPITS